MRDKALLMNPCEEMGKGSFGKYEDVFSSLASPSLGDRDLTGGNQYCACPYGKGKSGDTSLSSRPIQPPFTDVMIVMIVNADTEETQK